MTHKIHLEPKPDKVRQVTEGKVPNDNERIPLSMMSPTRSLQGVFIKLPNEPVIQTVK